MPLNKDIKKVLVIGSGPIVIGQAAEFDYAGTQACRALKADGIEIVLVNSNPATIMTDNAMADHIYIEPLTLPTIKRIIEKEKPDSILSGLGGQTGLTLSMQLAKEGFLESTTSVCSAPLRRRSIRPRTARSSRIRWRASISPASLEGRHHGGGRAGVRRGDHVSGHHPPGIHAGRHRRRHRQTTARSLMESRGERPRAHRSRRSSLKRASRAGRKSNLR